MKISVRIIKNKQTKNINIIIAVAKPPSFGNARYFYYNKRPLDINFILKGGGQDEK